MEFGRKCFTDGFSEFTLSLYEITRISLLFTVIIKEFRVYEKESTDKSSAKKGTAYYILIFVGGSFFIFDSIIIYPQSIAAVEINRIEKR